MKQQLHPGAKWLFRLRAYFPLAILGIFFFVWTSSVITTILGTIFNFSIESIFIYGITMLIVYIAFVIGIAEIYAQMSYNRWFYEFTPTNLKVEKGIILKQYSNVPYERVQNVDIQRGIIARLLGFSSVNIQTAGYSMPIRRGYGMQSEGYIPAVTAAHAEEIREFVMKKISKRSGGL